VRGLLWGAAILVFWDPARAAGAIMLAVMVGSFFTLSAFQRGQLYPLGEVRLSARIEGPVLEIEVADTGCGIPEEVLPRIFFPFERGDNSFQALHGGTGPGLILVRRLAEAHGGTCRVESAVGRGTTFFIRQPIVSAEEIPQAA
jgi:signal transduction histidine kinase